MNNNKIMINYPQTYGMGVLLYSAIPKASDYVDSLLKITGKDWSFCYIYTPNLSQLLVKQLNTSMESDFRPDEKDSINSYFANMMNYLSLYGTISYQSDATKKYNCHGYAFHMQDGHANDSVVIDNSSETYVNDSSYEVVNESEAEIAIFGNHTHSARRLSNGLYESKWGLGPKYIHSLAVAVQAYNGTPTFYRRTIPVLNGPSYFCSSSNYSVTKLPPSSNVVWRTSGAAYLMSGQGTSTATIGKSYNGTGNVYADIYVDGTLQRTLSITGIAVGPPSLALFAYPVDVYGNMGYWTAGYIGNKFVVDTVMSQYYTSYEAYLYRINGSTQTQLWHGTGLSEEFLIPYTMSPGWYKIRIRGYGDCGYSDWWNLEVQAITSLNLYSLVIDYNSESETVAVKVGNDEENASGQQSNRLASSQSEREFIVQLWSDSKLIRSFKTDQDEFTISMAGLKSGIYFVRIIKNGRTYADKFVKK